MADILIFERKAKPRKRLVVDRHFEFIYPGSITLDIVGDCMITPSAPLQAQWRGCFFTMDVPEWFRDGTLKVYGQTGNLIWIKKAYYE